MGTIMSIRFTYLAGFIAICALLLASLYLQYVEGIMPCPLCMLQRFSFGLIGVIFFLGIFIHASRVGRLFVNLLSVLFSLVGMGLAGRQIWLQHFTTGTSSECGVSLQYMVQALPVNEVIQKIFAGSAECTQRGWEFLTLDMAEWALICFILLFLLSIRLLFWKKK